MVPAELSVAKQRSLSWSASRTDLAIVAAAAALTGVPSLLVLTVTLGSHFFVRAWPAS